MTNLIYWKNDLPDGWKLLPLKAVAHYEVSSVDKLVKEEEIPVLLCNYTDVYKNDFITADIEFMPGSATEAEVDNFKLEEGDVIITKDSESWDDIAIPALVKEAKENLVCGYHLAVIKTDKEKLNPEYLLRCLQSKEIRLQMELASTGVTRYGLPKDAIGRTMLPVPKIEKQNRIVEFIEARISEIDKLITEKEKLIILLEEQRQALITQAVTKGIKPKVKLKDSGIEWLGKIPEHWELKKLKYISFLRSGYFITSENINPVGEYPVFGGNGQRGFTSNITHSGKFVLIGRQGALCGNINYAEGEFWASEHAIVCNPISEYDVFWLGELLRVMNLNQYSVSAAQPGLSVEAIKNLKIPYPNVKEQIQIVEYLKRELQSLDEINMRTLTSINLLQEKRAALISAAVLGKITI